MVLCEDRITPSFLPKTFLVFLLSSSLVGVLGKPFLSNQKSFPLGSEVLFKGSKLLSKEVGSPQSKEVVDEGIQTFPQPATSSPDPHTRPREPTASPEDPKTKKKRRRRGWKPLTKRRSGWRFWLERTPRRKICRRKTRKHRRGLGVHALKHCS